MYAAPLNKIPLQNLEILHSTDNPTANVAGEQHWGHATSKDLYTWTNQQIAIFPGSEEEGIFSGSAVIDSNNTSGMFPNQTNGVVAIYTINTPQRQTQVFEAAFRDLKFVS